MQSEWCNPNRIPAIRILLLINTIILSADYCYSLSFEENGFIENAQVLVLIISMTGFLYAALTSQIRSFALLCAVICFAFLLREVDMEDLNIPSLAITLFSGDGKYVTLLTLLCPTLYLTLKNHSLSFLVRNIAFSFKKLAALITLFFILSWIFDKSVIQTNQNAMLEELFELNGYILIFFIALLYSNHLSQRQIQRAD